jgi:hypothetical protein
MPPSKSEILVARLTRIKTLISAFEKVSADSAEGRKLLVSIKREMDAARTALKDIVPPPGSSASS